MAFDLDSETLAAIERRFAEARERQADRGLYALLYANGMSFPDLVELIGEDAIMTMGDAF